MDHDEQLLPPSFRIALFQLRSGYCSRLQSYRHCVGWADDPTYHHSLAHFFTCLTRLTDLAPGGYVDSTPPSAQFLVGPPQFANIPPLRIFFIPSLLHLHSRRRDSSPFHGPSLTTPSFYLLLLISHLVVWRSAPSSLPYSNITDQSGFSSTSRDFRPPQSRLSTSPVETFYPLSRDFRPPQSGLSPQS